MFDQLWAVLLAIIPSVGVGYLFYRVMKVIIEGDRRERLAYNQWLAEHGDDEAGVGRPAAGPPVNDGAPPVR